MILSKLEYLGIAKANHDKFCFKHTIQSGSRECASPQCSYPVAQHRRKAIVSPARLND